MFTETLFESASMGGITAAASLQISGNSKVQFDGTVGAGSSHEASAAVKVAEMKAFLIVSDQATVAVTTDQAETLMGSGKKKATWNHQSGESNPVSTDFASITINNTGSEDAVVKFIFIVDDAA